VHGLPAGDEDRTLIENRKSVLVPVGLFGTAVAALGLRAPNGLLRRGAQRVRTNEARDVLKKIGDLCKDNHIEWWADNEWRVDGIAPHLLPRYPKS